MRSKELKLLLALLDSFLLGLDYPLHLLHIFLDENFQLCIFSLLFLNLAPKLGIDLLCMGEPAFENLNLVLQVLNKKFPFV